MTVILGTLAHATAVTILAPSLAIPPASYSLPTMKPRAKTHTSWGGADFGAPPPPTLNAGEALPPTHLLCFGEKQVECCVGSTAG